ncbi:MAG TPA: YicC/YloC family endoribonuclease, partial [Bacillales bacterium]|nr:YicC/YloC family endoribonuclease [Bacillales bacterium]
SEIGNEELEMVVLKGIEEAVILLKEMRLAEGEELKKDITGNLYQLETAVIELRKYAPLVVQGYKERLTKRMMEFLNGQDDEARILTEVAVFADKADINEEMTRLCSHIQQFLQTIEDHEPIGRKLDFLVQEMNREVNTIGSKANDANIAKTVVEMKSLLEKLKEQIQNIE